MQKTMDQRLEVLGARHPDTMKFVRHVGVAWFKQHRYDKSDNIKALLLDLSRTVARGDKNLPTTIEDLAGSRAAGATSTSVKDSRAKD